MGSVWRSSSSRKAVPRRSATVNPETNWTYKCHPLQRRAHFPQARAKRALRQIPLVITKARTSSLSSKEWKLRTFSLMTWTNNSCWRSKTNLARTIARIRNGATSRTNSTRSLSASLLPKPQRSLCHSEPKPLYRTWLCDMTDRLMAEI